MANKKITNDVLDALLNAEATPEAVVPMKRFGVDFRVRAISLKEIKQFRMQATHFIGKREVIDEELFASLVIAEASIVPNWSDPQLLAKYETNQASDVVAKRLLDGEKAYLAGEIMSVSGFDQDERIRDIKN
jgi:hypothetical protein